MTVEQDSLARMADDIDRMARKLVGGELMYVTVQGSVAGEAYGHLLSAAALLHAAAGQYKKP